MCKQPHAFLDIETTGLDPVVHDALEVAYILEPEGEIVNVSLPFVQENADPKALEINGWGKRPFAPFMPPKGFALKLQHDLKDRIIIGNNVQFDMGFLREFLRKQGVGGPTWYYNVVDIKAIAGGACGKLPPWDTAELCELIGTDPPDATVVHTALGDTVWNRDFYRAIYRLWEL